MKILIVGAGVIGTTYAWQLAQAGYDITLLVRKGKASQLAEEGIHIHCTDERSKKPQQVDTLYRPRVVDDVYSGDRYEMMIVCVKANQLDGVLPLLEEKAGRADILFFLNNWLGDQKIKARLKPSQYLFGFSKLVSGWRTASAIECMISSAPGMSTMIGEPGGQLSPRVTDISAIFAQARLKPEISRDILGWLAAHYVEYVGGVGGMLKAGSVQNFASNSALVREAILATREGLDVCRARGIDVGKSAPSNLKMYSLPLFIIVPLGKLQYGMKNIQQFFEESIAHNLDELTIQYYDVLNEGKRLGVRMPHLESFEPYYARYR